MFLNKKSPAQKKTNGFEAKSLQAKKLPNGLEQTTMQLKRHRVTLNKKTRSALRKGSTECEHKSMQFETYLMILK